MLFLDLGTLITVQLGWPSIFEFIRSENAQLTEYLVMFRQVFKMYKRLPK